MIIRRGSRSTGLNSTLSRRRKSVSPGRIKFYVPTDRTRARDKVGSGIPREKERERETENVRSSYSMAAEVLYKKIKKRKKYARAGSFVRDNATTGAE